MEMCLVAVLMVGYTAYRVLAILCFALADCARCIRQWRRVDAAERLWAYLGIALHTATLFHGAVTGSGAELCAGLLSGGVFVGLYRRVLSADLKRTARP